MEWTSITQGGVNVTMTQYDARRLVSGLAKKHRINESKFTIEES